MGTATAPQFEEGRTAVGLVAEHGFSALVTVGGLIGGLHLSGPAFEPVIAPTVNSPPDAVDRSGVRSAPPVRQDDEAPTDAGRSAAVARYVFLMYDAEDWYDTADEQAVVDEMRLHEEFMEAVRAAGASVVGGEALQPSSTASTVRRRRALVTDGPFADTKEALGGFYVIDAPDLDVALRLGEALPGGQRRGAPGAGAARDAG